MERRVPCGACDLEQSWVSPFASPFAPRCSLVSSVREPCLRVSCGECPGLRLHRLGLAACMVWLDAHFSSLSAPPGIGDSGQPRIFRRRLDPHGSVCPRKILVCPIPECNVGTRPVSMRRKGRKNRVVEPGCARWSAMLGRSLRRRADGGLDGPRCSVAFYGGGPMVASMVGAKRGGAKRGQPAFQRREPGTASNSPICVNLGKTQDGSAAFIPSHPAWGAWCHAKRVISSKAGCPRLHPFAHLAPFGTRVVPRKPGCRVFRKSR